MTKQEADKLSLRIEIRKMQLDGLKAALIRDIEDLHKKLGYAMAHLRAGEPNRWISANMGYQVADIVRRQKEVEGAEREIKVVNEILCDFS
jgi:hypothetical protein